MKLLGRTEKLINKIKNRENGLSLEVVEVVLVQCNLVVLYTFTPNVTYAIC